MYIPCISADCVACINICSAFIDPELKISWSLSNLSVTITGFPPLLEIRKLYTCTWVFQSGNFGGEMEIDF